MDRKYGIKLFWIKLLSIAVDLLTVSFVFTAFVLIKKAENAGLPIPEYINLWPFLLLFWLVFEKMGLYEGTSIHSGSSLGPIEELRRLFYALSALFIGIGFANFCYRPNDYLYSRIVLTGTYICCLFLIPLNRFVLRKILIRCGCWGIPAIIIGSGETAAKVFINMALHPEYGLRPIGYFTDCRTNQMPENAVFLGKLCDIPKQAQSLAVKYAVLAKDTEVDSPYIQNIIRQYGILFPHLLLIPGSLLHTCSGVLLKDISGMLGLEVRHNLQIPNIYRIKRIIDFLLTIPCFIAALPLMGVIAIIVKVSSSGPVFFKHQRIAKDGRQIYIYKFRTMVDGASEKLNDTLQANQELEKEWKKFGKIENDPRITRIGKWLRKTSFDELPQLFNVLQGRLTLVGPRPIIAEELSIYGEAASLFNRVLPGITGLWQVSGRNELTYEERAKLDSYYVNNWSIWLDLHILAKTFFTVFLWRGAK